MDNIKIITWNANGLTQRREELQHYLTDNNIEVAFINETHLKPYQKLGFSGYNIIRTDRKLKQGGGTAILLRNNLRARKIHQQGDLEATIVETEIGGNRLILASIYMPPNKDDLNNELTQLLKQDAKLIIGGDFNAHSVTWGGRYSTKRGKMIEKIANEHKCDIRAPDTATSYPTGKRGDIIDFFITKGIKVQSRTNTDTSLLSDHAAVLLTIPRQGKKLTEIYTKKFTNWKKFKEQLQSFELNATLNTEEQITELTEAITNARQQSTIEVSNQNNKLFLNRDEKWTVKLKHMAKQRFIKNRTKANKEALNAATNEVKRMLKDKENLKWNKKIQEINDENPNKLWEIARFLRREKSRPQPLRVDNGYIYNDREIAEKIADHLEETFTNNQRSTMDGRCRKPNRTITQNTTEWSKDNIKNIIQNLPNKKAPGTDGIRNEDLKQAPENIVVETTKLLNRIKAEQIYPKSWKKSLIIPIPKKDKDPTIIQNKRPISLLNTFAKLLEILIKEDLQEHLDTNAVIPKCQYGFKKSHSAVMQAENLASKVDRAKKKGRGQLIAVLLDMEKAYDRTWRKGLIHKITTTETPTETANLIASFLEDRTFQVKVNKATSSSRIAREGLPQGSPLSPILFNVMAYDIPKKADILQFADDIAILTEGKNIYTTVQKAEKAANQILKWAKRWKMKINETKTEAARLSGKRNTAIKLKIGKSCIEMKRHIKYLGITFNQSHNFNTHYKNRRKIAQRTFAKLRRLTINEALDQNHKMRLVTKILEPQISYGMEVTINRNPKIGVKTEGYIMRKIKKAGNFERRTTNVEIRNTIHRTPVHERAETQRINMLNNIEISNNNN